MAKRPPRRSPAIEKVVDETHVRRWRGAARHAGIKIETGTAEDFFKRSLERARKLDRGERLPAEMRLTFEDPADLMRILSAQRIRVLWTVRSKARPVSELAHVLKRDRKAVSRDVKLLESFGLVRLHEQPNPGHGLMKVVEPLAERYQLVATI